MSEKARPGCRDSQLFILMREILGERGKQDEGKEECREEISI
jgi:hypothetical protein